MSASASAGILTFKAKRTAGPPTSMPGTFVSVSIGGQGPGGFGCWVVPDSMLTINSDLSAALHFRSDAPGVTLCPGFAIASGLPVSGMVPLGGGTEPPGFIGPVALDLLWPASSPLFESRSTSNASCGPFIGNSVINFSDNLGAFASGTISATLQGFDSFGNPAPLPINASLTSQFADVNTFKIDTVVNGPMSGSCGPFRS